MTTYYKSKLGETLAKEDWMVWGKSFYAHVESEVPANMWERIVKVLKLKKVTLIIDETDYVDLEDNFETRGL